MINQPVSPSEAVEQEAVPSPFQEAFRLQKHFYPKFQDVLEPAPQKPINPFMKVLEEDEEEKADEGTL